MDERVRHAWFNGKLVGVETSASGTDETMVPYDHCVTLFRWKGILKKILISTVVNPNEVDIVKSRKFDAKRCMQPVKLIGKEGKVVEKGWYLETSNLL